MCPTERVPETKLRQCPPSGVEPEPPAPEGGPSRPLRLSGASSELALRSRQCGPSAQWPPELIVNSDRQDRLASPGRDIRLEVLIHTVTPDFPEGR
jgi:hypothetical protein